MIREIKCNKKLGSLNRKNVKKNKKNLHNKKTKKNIQSGGNKSKEDFEITTLDNIDPSKFSVSKYINANIDWGIMPGPPPTDCCIM